MPSYARQAGLEALRAVLRRHHPGLDVIFELEREDGAHDTPAREIRGSLTAPQDSRPVSDGVDVPAAALRAADHNGVDETCQDLSPVRHGER